MKLSKKAQVEFDKLNVRIKELEDQLQDLNLKYKYETFDLEATRREYAYLRQMLEESE